MTVPRTILHAGGMFLCIALVAVSANAQEGARSAADQKLPNPFQSGTATPEGKLESGPKGEPRDPTAPPESLLQMIPKPAATNPSEPPTTAPSVRPRVVVASLPTLPKISLRGIVMSTSQRGRAMLDVDGDSVTISLLPRDQQLRMPIPETQFESMKAALEQRAARRALEKPNAAKPERKNYEMCLQCSFVSGETVFNVEAFTADAILLRAIPHESLILVRRTRP